MADSLVYLSYGQDRFHQETMFSILSALHFGARSTGGGTLRLLVYTDRPADYGWLRVDTRMLTPALMDEWLGQGGYPFRRKIACVLDALETAPGKLAFLDGDTYFKRPPTLLFDRIEQGRACLHLREKRLTRRPGSDGAVLRRLFGRAEIFDAAGGAIELNPQEGMWNSGVIGIDRNDISKVEEALVLIDDIWAHEQSIHTLEQFALGHVFGERCLRETADLIFHYWHHRVRVPFLARLPAIIDHARTMPLEQGAAWAYAERPTETCPRRASGLVKNMIHRMGVDRRWLRTSF